MRYLLWIATCIIVCSCISCERTHPESGAEKALKRMIALNPDDAEAHYRLGLQYYSENRYGSARVELSRALEIKPEYAEAHYALGLTLAAVREHRAAIESYKKALVLKPDYGPEALNQIGSAYRDIAYRDIYNSRPSIEKSLDYYLKAEEKCGDVNKSLCLAIYQNIAVTYMDLHAMDPGDVKNKRGYLRKAIYYAKKGLTPKNREVNTYHYAMLQYSLGQAYALLNGRENALKAEQAYNDAIFLLNSEDYKEEYNSILHSKQLLRQKSPEEGDSEIVIEDGLVIQFVNEHGNPLSGAKVGLYEQRGSEFIKAHFRKRKVDENGKLRVLRSMLKLPQGSELFIYTEDEYYFHSVKIDRLKVVKDFAKVAVPKTGKISATIDRYAKGIRQPLVVPVSRLNKHGSYEEFYGIGIGLAEGYPFTLSGLSEGIYKIQIKKDYDDSSVYYEKEGIRVVPGKTTDIGGVELRK